MVQVHLGPPFVFLLCHSGRRSCDSAYLGPRYCRLTTQLRQPVMRPTMYGFFIPFALTQERGDVGRGRCHIMRSQQRPESYAHRNPSST